MIHRFHQTYFDINTTTVPKKKEKNEETKIWIRKNDEKRKAKNVRGTIMMNTEQFEKRDYEF